MMRVPGLALRNLSRQKKRTFLLAALIAFCVFVVTLINGAAGGLIENISNNFSHLLAGHVFVEGKQRLASGRIVRVIREDREILDVLKRGNFRYRYLLKRSNFTGNMIFEGKRVTLRIDGVQWEEETYLREHLVLQRGSWEVIGDPRSIIISEEMARILGARIGDRLLVELRTATGQQNVGEFILGAVHFQPALLSTVSAYASLSAVNRLLNIDPDQYMTLGIYLEELSEIETVAERVYRALQQAGLEMVPRTEGGQSLFPFLRTPAGDGDWQGTRFQLSTLNDYLSQVMQIVSIVDTISLVVLVVLLFIVTVGIANTFRMIMFERIQEIGTMRALGLQRSGVRALFLLEALFLCLLGVAAGLAVFALSVLGLGAFDWGLDSPMFLFLEAGHLSFRLRGAQTALSLGLVCFMTVLSAFLPAQAAARLEPVKALGVEH